MSQDAAVAVGPELVPPVRRYGPLAFIAALATLAAVLIVPWLGAGAQPLLEPRLSLPVLFAVWIPFELVMLYLLFADDVDNADSFMLTEVPLTLGLLFATPTDLLLVGVGAPVLVDLVRRKKGATKQVFNGVNRAVEVALALALFRLLDLADPLSTSGWLALVSVATVSSVAMSLDVSLVISLAIGWLPRKDFWAHVLVSVPMAVGGVTVGFCAALALQAGTQAFLPLVGCLLALLLLLRGLTLMTERHLNLVKLQGLGHGLASATDADSVLATSLTASAQLLLGRSASAYLPSPGDASVLRRVALGADGSLTSSAVARSVAPLTPGITGHWRRVVAAATSSANRHGGPAGRSGGGPTGGPVGGAGEGHPRAGTDLVLCVEGRPRSLRPFDAEDVRVLDMVAQQTSRALHTAELVEQLRHDALHDPLTSLPNRRSFLDSLEERLAEGTPVAVALVRARDLKVVNAALGHDRGDDLLVEMADRLRDASGDDTVVARVGGDGFAVLLPSRGGSRASVERLLSTLSRPFTMSGVDVLARACAGVADTSGASAVTARDLLRRADIAMRYARRTGRDVEAYTAEMDTATPERLSLAADLQAGLPRNELVLFAQPQVRLADGAVTGVEMLVRWNHPVRGLLPPGEFIPVAEQTGLDRPMTAWVLNAALKALAGWRADGLDLTVSVNVPPSALEDGQLTDVIDELLTLRGLDGGGLVVEITESSLLTNVVVASEVLHRLSGLGVKVSVDDFGTGFSSLSHLRRLPVDEIKIDRSFVGTMLQSSDDAAIVRSVIELARALSLTCVAEGVEDEHVYTALRRLGCDAAQGYFMAAPMPLPDLPGWLRAARRSTAGIPAWGSLDGRTAVPGAGAARRLRARIGPQADHVSRGATGD